MINNPSLNPRFLAHRFVHPLSLFVNDSMRQKPGESITNDVLIFLKQHAQGFDYAKAICDPDQGYPPRYYEKALYYTYAQQGGTIYGLPDLFYDTCPQMALYYCEHANLRATQQESNRNEAAINGTAMQSELFLAEGLLLLQAAVFYCKNPKEFKFLFCLASNEAMLTLLEPYIITTNSRYPLLHIPDITALPYVTGYLQTHGFTDMPLQQTELNVHIYSKCVIEQDDTVFLFVGFG